MLVEVRSPYNQTVKTLKTLKLRIKDKHASELGVMAREVNQVWNYTNALSYRSIRERHQWLSAYELQAYTAGFSKCEGVKIGSATVQLVCKEYAIRRKQFKKARLNWRVSHPRAVFFWPSILGTVANANEATAAADTRNKQQDRLSFPQLYAVLILLK